MGWVFLVVSAYGALYTLNAYRPIKRSRLLFLWAFMSSWLTIEGALFHVAWQVVAAGVFVWLGALDQLAGWVGLAISLVSWAGLLVLYVRGRATTAVFEHVMAEVAPAPVPRAGRRSRVHRTRNVEFARVGGQRLKLDVIEPAHRDEGLRPAVVQVHGGAWVAGSKNEQGLPLLRLLAANGWVGFTVNYRLSPAATWPEHLEDVKRSIAWVREHAVEYDVDPDFVAVTGGSAGGHLAAMVGLTGGDTRFQPGFEEADCSVQAAVPFYGVFDFTNEDGAFPPEFHRWLLEPFVMKDFYADRPDRFRDASPVHHLRTDAPPFLVVHGTNDTLAPVSDARRFVSALADRSEAAVLYAELPGAQHAFDVFSSPRTNRVVRGVHRFLCAARSGTLPPARSTDEPISVAGGT
jgi:acetyl esterase/lipase